MRITNKIMQHNNLSNINTNKVYQDKLSTQMSTQKKINRPSEDPVIAIRALRLRSNVTEITQYYGKNIPDAESWLDVTEDAIKNLSQIITNMIGQCTTGSNGDLKTQDRQIILEQLQALSKEVYSTGDADYAGRYVFTGYRTDTSLSFLEAKKQTYTMTEQLDGSAIDMVTKVNTGKLLDINSGNYNSADYKDVIEQDISSVDVYRIRLAYNDCDFGDEAVEKAWNDYKTAQSDLIGQVQDKVKELNDKLAALGARDVAKAYASDRVTDDAIREKLGLSELNGKTAADIDNLTDEEFAELEAKLGLPLTAEDFGLNLDGADFNNLSAAQWTDITTALSDAAAAVDTVGGTTTEAAAVGAWAGAWKTDWDANEALRPQAGTPTIQFTTPGAAAGVFLDQTWSGQDVVMIHSYEDPYTYAAKYASAIVYVPETGEVLLGKDRYEALAATKDREGTIENEAEIRVTYDKSNWLKGDLRPEHYFACKADGVDYNMNYLEPDAERQIIEYDVGYNQTIRINSTADECFQHAIGREADDVMNAVQNVLDLEGLQATLTKIKEGIPEDDEEQMKIIQNQLDAVDKALVLAKDKEQRMFEGAITSFQKHLDKANLCVTDCGARDGKLELIKNRMQNQKTTYETLKSENEDIDITEVAIQLNSAELTYDAALMAAGKVMQSTLLNFI